MKQYSRKKFVHAAQFTNDAEEYLLHRFPGSRRVNEQTFFVPYRDGIMTGFLVPDGDYIVVTSAGLREYWEKGRVYDLDFMKYFSNLAEWNKYYKGYVAALLTSPSICPVCFKSIWSESHEETCANSSIRFDKRPH